MMREGPSGKGTISARPWASECPGRASTFLRILPRQPARCRRRRPLGPLRAGQRASTARRSRRLPAVRHMGTRFQQARSRRRAGRGRQWRHRGQSAHRPAVAAMTRAMKALGLGLAEKRQLEFDAVLGHWVLSCKWRRTNDVFSAAFGRQASGCGGCCGIIPW
jgi:hypothetical protein